MQIKHKQTSRTDRLAWLGDMEPEYENMLEWQVFVKNVAGKPPRFSTSLHGGVVAKASSGIANKAGRVYR